MLMHMRGDAGTMQSLAHYGSSASGDGSGLPPSSFLTPGAAGAGAQPSHHAASADVSGGARGGAAASVVSTSSTSGSPSDEPADGSAVVADVRVVLAARAAAAIAAGVRRWSILLDPGLGFAKQPAHSYALLRPSGSLTGLCFPLLYAPSRKAFLGAVCGSAPPGERGWATAAAVAACVGVGADIVRVHDVRDMRDVVAVADAVWRGGGGVPALVGR